MTNETRDSELVPEVQRQYSLLREFNLEQAKAGDEILHLLSPSFTYTEVLQDVKFKGVTSNLQEAFVEDKQGEGYCYGTQRIKMKPLTWIEGKPVYKGDVLYFKLYDDCTVCEHKVYLLKDNCLFDESGTYFVETKSLTWTKPKEKHIHQELIDAYKAGAKIQYWSCLGEYGYYWKDIIKPCWITTDKYRIKPPEPEKKSGWINIWTGLSGPYVKTGVVVHSTKSDAISFILNTDNLVDTIEIHWAE